MFACNTCTPEEGEPAGICLACANKCHDGHDIFELYTKRSVVRIKWTFGSNSPFYIIIYSIFVHTVGIFAVTVGIRNLEILSAS